MIISENCVRGGTISRVTCTGCCSTLFSLFEWRLPLCLITSGPHVMKRTYPEMQMRWAIAPDLCHLSTPSKRQLPFLPARRNVPPSPTLARGFSADSMPLRESARHRVRHIRCYQYRRNFRIGHFLHRVVNQHHSYPAEDRHWPLQHTSNGHKQTVAHLISLMILHL